MRKQTGEYLAQILAQNWGDWDMNGSLFLKKLVFVRAYFQIWWSGSSRATSQLKPNLSVPHPQAYRSSSLMCM